MKGSIGIGLMAAATLAALAGMDSGITLAAATRAKDDFEPSTKEEIKTPSSRMPHQGYRERERRRRQLAKAAAKS